MTKNKVYLKDFLKKIYVIFLQFGFDPRKTIYSIMGLPFYIKDFIKYNFQKNKSKLKFKYGKPYPILNERFLESGTARGHYFHQDLLVAQKINVANPIKHVDVGSRVDGFIAHVASFRKIEVIDIRELNQDIPNIHFVKADMMVNIDENLVNYCDSLSCLHALEHFGLGRYNDPVKFDGHIIGFNNIQKILKSGGKFYFSVPIGPQRVEFNAHRVFSIESILNMFSNRFSVDSFSYVNDKGNIIFNADLTDENIRDDFGCFFGCGIFEMTKY